MAEVEVGTEAEGIGTEAEEIGTEAGEVGTGAEEEALALKDSSATDAKRMGTLRRIALHLHQSKGPMINRKTDRARLVKPCQLGRGNVRVR